MTDIITALNKKKSTLVRRKQEITTEAKRQIEVLDTGISEVNKAIETLNEAVKDYLCPRCKGTGNIRRCDAAGQMEDDTCPDCRGTGVSSDTPTQREVE